MSQPPAYPPYPAFPPYPTQMPYYQGSMNGNDSTLLNFIQDTAIGQSVTESARNITRDIGQTDRNLTQSINETGSNLCNGVSAIKDTIFTTNGGVRDLISSSSNAIKDSVDRNGLATNSTLNILEQSNSNRARDIINDINAGGVATNLGIAALNVANADRSRDIMQTTGDFARDGVAQMNRGVSDVMTSIAANGVSGLLATTTSGFEIKTLINQGNAAILSSSASQYSSLLLENQKGLFETYKMKETLTAQMAESKYEALKNTERLSAQIAASSCEAKYEALKNTQMLSTQMTECCCELKEKVGHVYTKLDDTVRVLDGNRVRDALNVATNEINLLKAIDYSRRRDRSPERR